MKNKRIERFRETQLRKYKKKYRTPLWAPNLHSYTDLDWKFEKGFPYTEYCEFSMWINNRLYLVIVDTVEHENAVRSCELSDKTEPATGPEISIKQHPAYVFVHAITRMNFTCMEDIIKVRDAVAEYIKTRNLENFINQTE